MKKEMLETIPSTSSCFQMKLFANWESDRSSSSTVQRVLVLSLNRLTLFSPSADLANSLVLTFKLRNGKRSLRTSDIPITLQQTQSEKVTVEMNVAVNIHYPHFLKKSNDLIILIQRRKKYGKRKIPGFKDVAISTINLRDVLQNGFIKEVNFWLMNDYNKLDGPTNDNVAPFGILSVTNCHSQAAVSEYNNKSGNKIDELHTLSEEEDEQDSSREDVNDEVLRNSSYLSSHNRRTKHKRPLTSSKKMNQKNLKQKFVNLMNKLKRSDVDQPDKEGSIVVARTAQELEDWFEELENLSDSGPEFDTDRVSIISNPRPGLRPFFGSSNNVMDMYPVLEKLRSNASEETNETDEQDSSSEFENGTDSLPETSTYRVVQKSSSLNSAHNSKFSPPSLKQHVTDHCSKKSKDSIFRSSTLHSMNQDKLLNPPSSSLTFDSISSNCSHQINTDQKSFIKGINGVFNKKPDAQLFASILSATLKLDDLSLCSLKNVWLISTLECPILNSLYNMTSENVKLLDCQSLNDTKAAVQGIITKIQKFCNTNSKEPNETIVGICGGDGHISNVVRAYIESLQNKTNNNWINYLRFVIVSPTTSHIGKHLLLLYSENHLIEQFWKNLAANNTKEVEESMILLVCPISNTKNSKDSPTNSTYECNNNLIRHNLPLGEVMLQGQQNSYDSSRQLFIPFIVQVSVGEMEGIEATRPHSFDSNDKVHHGGVIVTQSQLMSYAQNGSSQQSINLPPASSLNNSPRNPNTSPPNSPSLPKLPSTDVKELQIEYWTVPQSVAMQSPVSMESYNFNQSIGHSQNRKEITSEKSTLKSSLKFFCVYRDSLAHYLTFQFLKEKRKDKVLQKFGRKKGNKNDDSSYLNSITPNISRMICYGKHSDLEVIIDGNTFTSIRFFQIASQWQTHVKFFPVAFAALNP